MRLIDDAGTLWHHFWSLRLALLSALLNAATVAATMLFPTTTSVRIAAAVGVLSFSSSIASACARLVKQPTLPAAPDAQP